MATKSINLQDTDLVVYLPSICLQDNQSLDADIMNNYGLQPVVYSWLIENKISYKFNTRKARIKFTQNEDAILFKVTWM